MWTIRFNPDELSTEELSNLAQALHEHCVDCIENGVPQPCMHAAEVGRFVDALAGAIDETLRERERSANAEALGVDDSTGEWLTGA